MTTSATINKGVKLINKNLYNDLSVREDRPETIKYFGSIANMDTMTLNNLEVF